MLPNLTHDLLQFDFLVKDRIRVSHVEEVNQMLPFLMDKPRPDNMLKLKVGTFKVSTFLPSMLCWQEAAMPTALFTWTMVKRH